MPRVTPASLRRVLRSFGMAAVAVLLALWAVLGPDRALCVGADGHVSVEAAARPCCEEGPTTPAPAQGDDSGDCGSCVDLVLAPLVGTAWERPVLPDDAPPGAAPCAAAISAPLVAVAGMRGARRARAPDPPDGEISRLLTVRRRC